MVPTRKSWSIDRIRRQFYSVFKERLNAAWAAYRPYCFSITNFGNTGVPGKPDFGLLGWKSGDFGNIKEAMTVERSRPRLRGLVFPITR